MKDREDILEMLPDKKKDMPDSSLDCMMNCHLCAYDCDENRGFNFALKESADALSKRVATRNEIRNTICSLPIKAGWGSSFGGFLRVFLKESAIKMIDHALQKEYIILKRRGNEE